jgi:steroid delta-isomerase-like uncharacterized protein
MAADPTAIDSFLRRVIDIYNSHEVDQFDSLLTEDCTMVRNAIEAHGRTDVKRVLTKLYRAFPDIEYRIVDRVAEGNKIAIRWQGSGTHRGDYLGLAPTGRQVEYDGITFYELEGDKIARIFVTANLLGLVRQLTIKEPEARPQPNT